MNRREYVVQALIKVVDGLTMEQAIEVMHEAHHNNIALVTVTAQETAEEYVTGLRRNGLTSTLEPMGSGGSSENDQ
jgi:ATP-dependent Clp protease adaptor protein ClpS